MRRLVEGASERMSLLAAASIALGLFTFVLCLEIVGPPPRWRIDALWVYGHMRTVRIMIAAVVIAAAASILVFLVGRKHRRAEERRTMIALLWVIATIACAALYWDRLPILYDVVMRYAW